MDKLALRVTFTKMQIARSVKSLLTKRCNLSLSQVEVNYHLVASIGIDPGGSWQYP